MKYKIIYIHGFNSSPNGFKGKYLKKEFGDNFYATDMNGDPIKALNKLKRKINEFKSDGIRIILVGSSLGGFYATSLSGYYDCPCVLINPSVEPYKTLKDISDFDASFYKNLEEIRDNIFISGIVESHTIVLFGVNDKHLDYRIAEKFYLDCKIVKLNDDHLLNKNKKKVISSIHELIKTNRVMVQEENLDFFN